MNPLDSHRARQEPIFCAVVPVHDDDPALQNVIYQLRRAHIERVIVVVNGCSHRYTQDLKSKVEDVFQEYVILSFREALGLDVPRAIGAMAALRKSIAWPTVEYLVFVDGDWRGSFGPTLLDVCETAVEDDCDVQFLSCHESRTNFSFFAQRPDVAIWNEVTTKLRVSHLTNMSPSHMPTVVRVHVFDSVSAYWLHHPGLWFARLLQNNPRLKLQVYPHDVAHSIGNPSRTRQHSEQLQITLLGDAVEGARLALGRKPSRTWRGRVLDGYHSARRIDILKSWAGVIHFS